jgi:hypothetical protein
MITPGQQGDGRIRSSMIQKRGNQGDGKHAVRFLTVNDIPTHKNTAPARTNTHQKRYNTAIINNATPRLDINERDINNSTGVIKVMIAPMISPIPKLAFFVAFLHFMVIMFIDLSWHPVNYKCDTGNCLDCRYRDFPSPVLGL